MGIALSIRLESLGLPAREAIATAANHGFNAVEFDAVGELSAKALSRTGRRELRHLLRSQGLSLSAIGFPTRHGYDELDRLDARIEATTAALSLAFELGCPMVINQIGKIPDPSDPVRASAFGDAIRRVANAADRVGSRFAIQTGLNTPTALRTFLEAVGAPSLGVNYSPAHLLMLGVDLAQGIEELHAWIMGVHTRDVVRSGVATTGLRDVPLGKGEIPWPSLFETLASIDYVGPYTLVGEFPNRPDLLREMDFLRSHLSR